MARGKPFSQDLRMSIINAHINGISARKISKSFSIPRSTVQDIINLFKENGNVMERKKTGRPSSTSKADHRALKKIVKQNHGSNVRDITVQWREMIGKQISVSTTKRKIKQIGFQFNKAKEKPLLTKLQKRNRLKWAKEHKNWTQEQWHSVIWSDESKFEVCGGDCSETYQSDCLVEKVKFPASVLVWGCMSGRGVGKLHFINGTVSADKYKDILEDAFLPSIPLCQSIEGSYVFQQDGAPCHTANTVKTWLENHNIPTLNWISNNPDSNPDLSPITSLWLKMKKELRKNPAHTVNELKIQLQQMWDNIEPGECAKLVDTMPMRIKTVLVNKGGATQY